MADGFVKVTGLEQVIATMKGLPGKMRGDASIAALKKAAKPMQASAMSRAPRGPTGRLRQNIYIAKARDSTPEEPLVVVRARRKGKASDPKNSFYWMFVEFGTVHSRAHPFLRPAFEATKNEALQVLKVELSKSVEKAAARR